MSSSNEEYLKEVEAPYTPLTAMEEASRCLLCMDAPCSRDCPAGTDPGAFIRAIRFRNFKGAAEIIRKNNILGGVCARVCPFEKTCEGACSRTGIDKPIQIGRLQRFATDLEKATGFKVLDPVPATKEKVALIGAGPASLAAAANLALAGYAVTIFEKNALAGGVLTYGIVPSRLPQYVVDEEIQYVKDLGVRFVFNTRIGKDITIDKLKEDGFKAIFIGVGLQTSKPLDVPGRELKGVVSALDFLASAKPTTGKGCDVGEYVVVIGGGDVAMDCATTAKHLGAKKVTVLYRRTREEMPAYQPEVRHVESIGVNFIYTFAPEAFIGKDGKVCAVKGKGTRDNSTVELQADRVVLAIGQKADEDVPSLATFTFNGNTIVSDEAKDCKTNIPFIFAAGDIVNGGKTVVQAVAAGKVAAKSIDEYLTKERAK
jgi:dihydropyrimidine dehydrogenase (NAD+) subunit PreT